MDLDKIRKDLEIELADVLSKSERLENHLRNKDRTLPDDWAELAQFVENDEVLEHLEVRSRERIEALQGALNRIEAGIARASIADDSHGVGRQQQARLELFNDER